MYALDVFLSMLIGVLLKSILVLIASVVVILIVIVGVIIVEEFLKRRGR